MKLAHFIKKHKEDITSEWVEFAEENIDCVKELNMEEVRDHILQMLNRIVESMETSENNDEQEEKSKGNQKMGSGESRAANQHGEQRADVGFDLMELSSEFRALRASVLRLWEANGKSKKPETNFQDMIRFNEAIDELWMISLKQFDHKVDQSKNWFMGTLGHDLRNPLAAIAGVQSILKLSNNLSAKERSLIGHSESSVKRMKELIDNLLELTRLRLGNGMPINKTPLDLKEQTENIVQELKLSNPHDEIIIESSGPVEGEWDAMRLDQLMTNLITNALRYKNPGSPVTVSVSKKGNEAFFKVHNTGEPLSKSIKKMISTGLVTKTDGDPTNKDSYGLGLYIVKAIVDGHKGQLKVISTEKSGTTFKITLPRDLKR